MSKNYQIIEPPLLDGMIVAPEQDVTVVALLLWVRDLLRADEAFKDVEIDVIPVTYHGTYPAIGIHYLNNNTPDQSQSVHKKITEILERTTMAQFLQYFDEIKTECVQTSNKLRGIEQSTL